jgi:hypothetical protein
MIAVDLRLEPESDALLPAIQRPNDEPRVKRRARLAARLHPVPAGWQGRSLPIAREGRLAFYHFDPYAQALAKLERAHAQDVEDVRALAERGLVEPARALAFLAEIEPQLHRFPAVDPPSFRRRVEAALGALRR